MNIIVHQIINIKLIKVGAITNSSVLQIGSTGSIQAHSEVCNSGGYTEPAEPAIPAEENFQPLVPLRQPVD